MKKINVLKPKFRTKEILNTIKECLDKGWAGMGFKTLEFEEAWKKYTNLPNAHFITSNTVKNILENKKNKTTVLVRKAEGIKCSRCWKILKKKCERNHCPIKQN